MFNYNGPMLFDVSLIHDDKFTPQEILASSDAVIGQLQDKPVDQAMIDRAIVKLRSGLYDTMTQFGGFGRADLLACFALFDDKPENINQIEANFRKVTPALIQKTAKEYLRKTNRTVVILNVEKAARGGIGGQNESSKFKIQSAKFLLPLCLCVSASVRESFF